MKESPTTKLHNGRRACHLMDGFRKKMLKQTLVGVQDDREDIVHSLMEHHGNRTTNTTTITSSSHLISTSLIHDELLVTPWSDNTKHMVKEINAPVDTIAKQSLDTAKLLREKIERLKHQNNETHSLQAN